MTFVAEDRVQKSRKEHHCCACGEKIPVGFEYVRSFSVDADGSISDKWHVECRNEFAGMLQDSFDDSGDPYDTWENGLPDEVKKKYGILAEV